MRSGKRRSTLKISMVVRRWCVSPSKLECPTGPDFACDKSQRTRHLESWREVVRLGRALLRDGHTLGAAKVVTNTVEESLRRVLQRENREVLPSVEKFDVEMHVDCRDLRGQPRGLASWGILWLHWDSEKSDQRSHHNGKGVNRLGIPCSRLEVRKISQIRF